ncbi:acriflavin resistance protein [Vibrio sp. MACH09]|uniref:efflux RND transporter permease subunit n=1 Tax=unclassified Vibrio TaxID=2614977 RepID=UPI001493405C|nr:MULTISPECIES: efflux RND transporter permease subunit [unclassified Vibrio]NOI68042.1 efflux RND transporter permease subunit [Vibrio sp. 99-8-1]GLO61203.1 acriflavin resistance protein [Vibrio sp. MACH09]
MMSWFLRNPVAANLLMVMILVSGYLTLTGLRSEAFPKLPANSISISTYFSGRTAEQVDQGLTSKIERALEGINGVKDIFSSSSRSNSYVQVVRTDNYPLDKLTVAIRQKLDAIENWPSAAEKAVIEQEAFKFSALIVQVYGGEDINTRQRVLKQVKKRLLSQPSISKVKSWGEEHSRVTLEVDPFALKAYALTLADLSEAVNRFSITGKSGLLKLQSGNLTLSADQQGYYAKDYEDVIIKTTENGYAVRIKDVLKSVDNYAEHEVKVRFNGKPALGIEVMAGDKSDVKEISEEVSAVLAKIQPQLPDDIKVTVWADTSRYIDQRLDLLKSNALQGVLLVSLLLALFLDTKLALWVAAGLPVAIAGTFVFMGERFLNYTFNEITTFGFILVLGILVDDAVVVGESVYSNRMKAKKSGLTAIQSTEQGVKIVAIPTIFGIATTIAAFMPMTQISSEWGKLFSGFAWVVIAALFMSLVESKLILPAHLAHTRVGEQNRVQRVANNTLEAFGKRIYAPVLSWSIKHRYSVIVLFIAVLIGSFTLVQKNVVRTVFFPEVPGDFVSINIAHHANTPLELVEKNAELIRSAAETINNEAGQSLIEKLLIIVSDETISVEAELLPQETRTLGPKAVVNRWRTLVGDIPAAWNVNFGTSEGSTTPNMQLVLIHSDSDVLQRAKTYLIEQIKQQYGVLGVRDNLKSTVPQLSFTLKEHAKQLGLTQRNLSDQLSNKFGGLEVQRMQRGNEEVRVEIRFPKKFRDSLLDLNLVQIRNHKGQAFPLNAIADVNFEYKRSEIIRKNGNQYSNITIQVDKGVTSAEYLYDDLSHSAFKEMHLRWPDLVIKQAGELEESKKSKENIKKALIISLIAIYALLAVPLKSYVQPIVIMSVIPFGFVGAVLGHAALGIPLSMLSFLGMMALAGVIVNDSLVLISSFNRQRRVGRSKASLHKLLVETGLTRLRAIFLTTVTTFAGLYPLMSETSEQAQYLIPAAVSLAYGELFGTGITLILIPVLLAIVVDVQDKLATKERKQELGLNDASIDH